MSKSQRKSDNATLHGKHVFEVAGLGVAPFRLIGFRKSVYQAAPDAPVQAGSCCAFCGTGIMYVCEISDKNGKTFGVGCDCVERTGDAGIIGAYKTSPEFRAMQRAKREAKDRAVSEEFDKLIHNDAVRSALASIPWKKWDGSHETYLQYIERVWYMCGASGRAKYLRAIRSAISKAKGE